MTIKATSFAQIPMRHVGPILITGDIANELIKVPLATYETPLWPSVARGAKVSRVSNGISVSHLSQAMTRSICFETQTAREAKNICEELDTHTLKIIEIIAATSRFAKLKSIQHKQVGRQVYLRLNFDTADASGHNMATKAADSVFTWLRQQFPACDYVSLSGNFCTDKKVSAVNGLLGRGHQVIAEIHISRAICEKELRTTPEALANLNTKKNLVGSMAAGSLLSGNAHFANMLLGIYLATGQDAANIVEGSQGFTTCEVTDDGVYFAVTLPSIVVGTVGNGKHLDFVEQNLQALGCREEAKPGANSKRLACIIAATVLCGELSLLAALTNPEELMIAHERIERRSHEP